MKQKTLFLCDDCGYESPKWYGKCPSCGAWNTMKEFTVKPEVATRSVLPQASRTASRPVRMDQIEIGTEERFLSGIGELDRVLGGGAVHGSFVLAGNLASANPHCCCKCVRKCAKTPEFSMFPAKSRCGRFACAPDGSVCPPAIFMCWLRPTWNRSSVRPMRSNQIS